MSIDALVTTISTSSLSRLPVHEKPQSKAQNDPNIQASPQAAVTKSAALNVLA